MNGQREAILNLHSEGMSIQNIALKLGLRFDDVLNTVLGPTDDAIDKRRFAVAEERSLTT